MSVFRDRLEVIEAEQITDRYGNVEYDWDNPVVVKVVAAHVDYTTSNVIDTNNRLAVENRLTAYCKPFGYDYTTQRLRWRGTEYRPDGDELIRNLAGRQNHIELPLKIVAG